MKLFTMAFEFFVEAFPFKVAACRNDVVLLSRDRESCWPSCCCELYPWPELLLISTFSLFKCWFDERIRF
jgi:hypothetical protein